MELGVKDRLLLLSILPDKGDYSTIKIVRQLREALSFTEDEHTEYGMNTNGDMITWDDEKAGIREILVGEKATDIIVSSLRKANTESNITEDLLPLYERLVLNADNN